MIRLLIVCWLAWASLSPALAQGADEDWVVGRWELVRDPDGGARDALEFTAEGDAYNVWSDGTRVPGMYIVTPQGVKAVFTHAGKDLIATFHVDAARRHLAIVTSRSGQESIYRKVD